MTRLLPAFALLLLWSAPFSSQAQHISLIPMAPAVDSPVAINHAGDGSNRLFIVERSGRVLLLADTGLLATPFLDIQGRVGCCQERGLLSIAFHPAFASNGYFFVNYTNLNFDTVIARYQVSTDANVAEANSEEILLTITQPFGNHNGGQIAFGPDGFLYIGMGDGGSGGDPLNAAQDPMSLLGKILRIDVDSGTPFGIPADNPFAADEFTRDEIWALGLRNPFRFSFDRITGDLYIADVGQDLLEEVHVHNANTASGENYGWRLMEGSQCFNPTSNCNNGSLTLPAFEYDHSEDRCSITGGFSYRGNAIKPLIGHYIYGDFCTGEILAANRANNSWLHQLLLDTNLRITSFGEDERGELYVADLNGGIFKLIPALSIAPASGTYLSSQMVDISLALRKTGVEVLSTVALLNGSDVSAAFSQCALGGTLSAGGLSFRCPAIPLSVLQPGVHRFEIELNLSDGNSVYDSVEWTVLQNLE